MKHKGKVILIVSAVLLSTSLVGTTFAVWAASNKPFENSNVTPSVITESDDKNVVLSWGDKGLIDIPIANKYYRLKQYQRQLEKTRNVKTALKILEQAAKDIGGQFTNRQEITGKDGGPVQTVNSEIPVPMEDYLKARREVLDEY